MKRTKGNARPEFGEHVDYRDAAGEKLSKDQLVAELQEVVTAGLKALHGQHRFAAGIWVDGTPIEFQLRHETGQRLVMQVRQPHSDRQNGTVQV